MAKEEPRRLVVSTKEFEEGSKAFAKKLHTWIKSPKKLNVYGIPKAGSIVAIELARTDPDGISVVYTPEEADVFVDDILDTGRTMKVYEERFKKKVYALYGKGKYTNCVHNVPAAQWIEFPWESQEQTSKEHQDFVIRLIEELGEDASREGLRDTPARFLKAWREMTSGYEMPLDDIRGVKPDNTLFQVDTHGMVVIKDIEFYSLCEHHLLPFVGKVHVAYLPDKYTIGLSKIPRIVDVFAQRLQTQERLGQHICDKLDELIKPRGVGVIIEASHFCTMMRGIKKQHSAIITSHVKGMFKEDARTREEFLSLTGMRG
jgi:GTP cyclohydrolase IA